MRKMKDKNVDKKAKMRHNTNLREKNDRKEMTYSDPFYTGGKAIFRQEVI